MMTQAEQTDAFAHDLEQLLLRYYLEFDLTYASMIGVLVMTTHGLAADGLIDIDDDDDGF